jgi:hypothetical protein
MDHAHTLSRLVWSGSLCDVVVFGLRRTKIDFACKVPIRNASKPCGMKSLICSKNGSFYSNKM